MRTKFLIRQNKWFIKGHILRGTFPLPDGMTTDILENRVNEMSDTSVLDMYYYVDDSSLPLHKGDRVMMGEFSWYVHDTVFDYNNNNLIYTLVR